jgi:hypothetical protein
MSPVNETDRLIRNLAREAGTERDRTAFPFERRLLLVAALSLAVAVAMVFLLFGVSADLMATVRSAPFHHKVASTLALAYGGFILVRNAARPDGVGLSPVALLPGVALLALGGATDVSGLPVMGRSGVSVPACVGAIVLLSLPPLAMIIGTLRTGASTRPTIAGATAGLLAGALGAAAYALACKNDGGLFMAIWYGAGILIVAGLGAVLGRRALAW